MKTKRYILGKALFSSGSGFPIAFTLNLAVLPFFAVMLIENAIFAALLIGLVFGTASVIRLFLIDYVENRYGLNIRPDHLITKCLRNLRQNVCVLSILSHLRR